jgi:hypothetical protein
MARSALVVFLVLVAVGSAACGVAGSHPTAKAPTAARFNPPDGWFIAQTSEPREPQVPIAWASNVAFLDDPSHAPFPDRTIRELPPDGIVLEAVGPWVYTGDEAMPSAEFPLSLSDLYCLADHYEGQPAPNVSFCNLAAHVGESASIFNAYVYFGRNGPTPEMRSAANDVLATLSLSG